MSRAVAIIGSGVVGLTTAITLAERGYRVVVYSDPVSPDPISSRVAPALFTPYPGPVVTPRFQTWTTESLRRLGDIAEKHGDAAGVYLGTLREYFYSPRVEHPWLDQVLATEPLEAPAGVEGAVGKRMHLDTTLYIDWLLSQTRQLKVEFIQRHVRAIPDVVGNDIRAVVNCAGLGARELTMDPALVAMRGVVVHVPNEIGLEYSLHDDAPAGRVAYVFRFKNHLVLGGTFEPQREDREIEPGAVEGILERCRQLLKVDGHARWRDLSTANATRTLVGLRPARIGPGSYEDIRLERDHSYSIPVIHNYGHCRQGMSVSWGTAAEVAGLVERIS